MTEGTLPLCKDYRLFPRNCRLKRTLPAGVPIFTYLSRECAYYFISLRYKIVDASKINESSALTMCFAVTVGATECSAYSVLQATGGRAGGIDHLRYAQVLPRQSSLRMRTMGSKTLLCEEV